MKILLINVENLINVEKPTIVDISTFISMVNTTSERGKARLYEQLKFRAKAVSHLILSEPLSLPGYMYIKHNIVCRHSFHDVIGVYCPDTLNTVTLAR